jgi:hypothetical protein
MWRNARVSVVVALLAVVVALPSAGARDDEVRRDGTCDLGSGWRLIARRESATTLRVRYVLDTDHAGQAWSIFLSMNGSRLFAGQRTTTSDGSIRVTRYPADRAGDDLIKGSANNLVTGESCNGSLTYRF